MDLDKNGSNESIVDLTVISSYPAKVRNKITNKAVGKTFTFSWPSAGPGGFTSSLAAGSSTGVGTIWDWQTGQTIYSFTGSICGKDVCFTPTNSSVGQRGPFSLTVPFTVPANSQPGRIQVYTESPRDGAVEHLNSVTVVLQGLDLDALLERLEAEYAAIKPVLEGLRNDLSSRGTPAVEPEA